MKTSRRTDGLTWGLVDLLTALMIVFMALAALALIPRQTQATAGVNPGNILVQLSWAMPIDADVDLWVQAPGERPVGYSNMGGQTFNLLRDDRGRSGDPNSHNIELAVGRATPDGEYVVNAMLYSSYNHQFPVPVHATVGVGSGVPVTIVDVRGELTFEGQEITMARFRLHDGHLVPGSVNQLFKPLRSAQ
jgi:hypothetical protein